MNNYYGNKGQFGGWGQTTEQFNNPYYSVNGGFNPFGGQFVNAIEKKNEKKRLSTIGWSFGFAVILYIVLSFAVSFVISILSQFLPRFSLIFSNNLAYLAYSALASILFVGAPFALAYFILRKKKYSVRLPFGTAYNRKAAVTLTMALIPVTLLTTFVINFISTIFQEITGIAFSGGSDIEIYSLPEFIMAVLSIDVAPAIVEEFAIRGVVLQSLRRYGDKFAIIVSAVLFSLIHGNMVQIPYTLFAGLYFGYLAVRTGSLWPSIILHFINNFYSVIAMWLTSNYSDAVASAGVLIMLGALIVSGIIGGAIFLSMRYKTEWDSGVKTLKNGEKLSAFFLNPPMIIAGILLLIVIILNTALT